jgi:hypothetical protein
MVSTTLAVLAWILTGSGIMMSVPDLIKVCRGNWPGDSEPARMAARSESWRNLRIYLQVSALGLAIFASDKHGALFWILYGPLFALVALNTGLWLRVGVRRVRRRLANSNNAA